MNSPHRRPDPLDELLRPTSSGGCTIDQAVYIIDGCNACGIDNDDECAVYFTGVAGREIGQVTQLTVSEAVLVLKDLESKGWRPTPEE